MKEHLSFRFTFVGVLGAKQGGNGKLPGFVRIQRKESRRDGVGGRQERGTLGASQTKEQRREGRLSSLRAALSFFSVSPAIWPCQNDPKGGRGGAKGPSES